MTLDNFLAGAWMKKAPAEGAGAYEFSDKVSNNLWDEQIFDVECFGTPTEAVSLEIEPIYLYCDERILL